MVEARVNWRVCWWHMGMGKGALLILLPCEILFLFVGLDSLNRGSWLNLINFCGVALFILTALNTLFTWATTFVIFTISIYLCTWRWNHKIGCGVDQCNMLVLGLWIKMKSNAYLILRLHLKKELILFLFIQRNSCRFYLFILWQRFLFTFFIVIFLIKFYFARLFSNLIYNFLVIRTRFFLNPNFFISCDISVISFILNNINFA